MDGFVVTFGDDCSGVLVLQVCFGTNLMDTPCELVRKVATPLPRPPDLWNQIQQAPQVVCVYIMVGEALL